MQYSCTMKKWIVLIFIYELFDFLPVMHLLCSGVYLNGIPSQHDLIFDYGI